MSDIANPQRLQLDRGDYIWANNLRGLPGELVADTERNELVLHNGVRTGGFRFLNEDGIAQNFQERNTELDGFSILTPTARGLLIRMSPGTYRLGRIEVDQNNLTVTNGDGREGNPTFALKQQIDSQHTFAEQITFLDIIDAPGGLEGDVRGNVLGDIQGNVFGNVTGDVTGNLAGDSEGKHTGDVDIRGSEFQADPNQIPPEVITGLVAALAAIAIPRGTLIDWVGSVEEIPAGWLLCDGENGTPDLRGRFRVMAGQGIEPGGTGGAQTHTHTTLVGAAGGHQHGITVNGHELTIEEIPSHNHPNGVVDKNDSLFNNGGIPANPSRPDSIDGNSSNGVREGLSKSTGGGQAHSHEANSNEAGNHTHTAETESGSSLPPYYGVWTLIKE